MKKSAYAFSIAMMLCILLSIPLEGRKKHIAVGGRADQGMSVWQILDGAVVINLNRQIYRFYETQSFMHAAGFINISRFEAIDGFTVHDDNFFPRMNIWSGSLAQKGCTASHLLVWEDFIKKSNAEYLFVCEDNMLPHSEFSRLFPLYWHQTPRQFDIVMVGNQMGDIQSEKLIVSKPAYCMHAYIISREGAKKLLALFSSIPRMKKNIHIIDIFLFEMMRKNKIDFYCYNGRMFPDHYNLERNNIIHSCNSGICFLNRNLVTNNLENW